MNLLIRVFISLFVFSFFSFGCIGAEVPVIHGSDEFHVLIPNVDSIHLQVSNASIQHWQIVNQGNEGDVSIHQVNSEEVFIIYSPKASAYAIDTVVISAESDAAEVALKTVVVYNYINKYQYEGERLLDRIHNDFYYNQQALYAEEIDSEGNLLRPVSYLWPASHLLRAFKNGHRNNPEKYFRMLRNYAISLDKYLSNASGKLGYAAFPGDQKRFYDDNGLMMIQLSEIYSQIQDDRMLDRAKWAYDFCNGDRDANWGIPQHEDELGQGMFYSMAVNQTGLGAALLYSITNESIYLTEAELYYDQLNNPQVLLKDAVSSLFHQYTFFQGGTWSLTGTLNGQQRNGAGFRAYQTSHVIQLALYLYQFTGDQLYLSGAKLMLNNALVYWYREFNGLNENAFWGGDDMIDALIDMYYLSGELKYLDISKNIIDFLIEFGKDQSGYYPSDYDDNYGDWNLDRRSIKPESVLMMGQAAAASAMLRIAYAIDNDPVVGVINVPVQDLDQSGYLVAYPTRIKSGNEIHLNTEGLSKNNIDVIISSVHGQMMQHEVLSPLVQPTIRISNHTPGLYILTLTQGSTTLSNKIFIE